MRVCVTHLISFPFTFSLLKICEIHNKHNHHSPYLREELLVADDDSLKISTRDCVRLFRYLLNGDVISVMSNFFQIVCKTHTHALLSLINAAKFVCSSTSLEKKIIKSEFKSPWKSITRFRSDDTFRLVVTSSSSHEQKQWFKRVTREHPRRLWSSCNIEERVRTCDGNAW